MIDAHLRKLRTRDSLGSSEEAALRTMVAKVTSVAAGSHLANAGESRDTCMLVLDGWIARAKEIEPGERGIVGVSIPGDFADLHALTLGRIDHDLTCLTRCRIGFIPHERFRAVVATNPHLAELYWLATNMDAAIQREWVAYLAGQSAACRLAHLLCEMFVRLEIIGRTEGSSCEFPLTQAEIGAFIGVTAVHANRVIQELRATGLISLERRRLTLLNPEGLASVARFNPAYLYVGRKQQCETSCAFEGETQDPLRPCARSSSIWPEFKGFEA